MTLFLSLDVGAPLPVSPPFLVEPSAPSAQLASTIKAILKARRIVVITGAGISVQAGIPDFRSPEGLFQSLKRDHPRDVLASGKDLFDASVFKSEHTTSMFCQMITQLSELSKAAQPTPFHRLLRSLDNSGKLLRVYTQNIDALESKAGLSFGVPGFEERRARTSLQHAEDSRLPTPPSETPRCIPLHGTLQNVHCQICNHSFPFDDHLPSFSAGLPPQCPECTAVERNRELVGKRIRGVGKLRPSVVLYNEAHKDGEGVGEAVRKDLLGSSKGRGRSGADLLLVVGTSLRVPGTKRMVREFSKATKSRKANPDSPDEESACRAIYLNLDFPVPTRDWEGVFDTWIQGDAQEFAELLQADLDKETRTKAAARERKRKREENHANSEVPKTPKKKLPKQQPTTPPKRPKATLAATAKHVHLTLSPESYSRTVFPPSPEYTPMKNNVIRIPPRMLSPSPSPPLSPSLPVTPSKTKVRSFFALTPPTPESPPRRPWTPSPSPLINVVDVDEQDSDSSVSRLNART
ncbi:DHS-like NAD/FAD-binding domain-containing protein [Mucidula mucida]|nr:DHS-like NAD/FAD-binding domain-containing protein [Mucidula mucida]